MCASSALPAALRSQVAPMQGPPFGPVKPALQMHCVSEVELAGEFDPDGQAVGAEAPGLGQYDPAGHTAVWIQWARPREKTGQHMASTT